MNRRAQGAKDIQALDVDFPTVSLPDHWISFLEASHLGYQLIQLPHLLSIS